MSPKTIGILVLSLLLAAVAPASATASESGAARQAKSSAKKTGSATKTAAKRPAKSRKQGARKSSRRKRHVAPPRLARVHKAFVASSDLRPMAMQLVEHRSPAAYAGVENYARKHDNEDAGALAWLLVGYCHYFDHEYAQAIEPLKKATGHAGELGDYVAYFLAYSYQQTGHPELAVSTIGNFEKTFDDSILAPQATVLYGTALTAAGHPVQAVNFLAAHRVAKPDVLLALGKAYAAAGEREKAIATLREVYFGYPVSVEADLSEDVLKQLARGGSLPEPTYDQQKGRIEALLDRGRFDDANRELKDLLKHASDSDMADWQLKLAAAYFRANRYAEMDKALEKVPGSTPEIAARKLYYQLEDDRPDQEKVLAGLARIRAVAPSSLWMQSALLATANMYLLARDYSNAAQYYTELYTRFPAGRYAATAHWRAGWNLYRMRRTGDAQRLFEEHIQRYPSDDNVAAAWYWLGRIAEQKGDRATAVNDYRYVAAHFSMYYYGVIARQRLAALGDDTRISLAAARGPGRQYVVGDPPADDLRAQKALLLENAALFDFAVQELEKADENEPWALPELVRLYQAGGRYDRALRLLKRSLPGYYTWEIPQLPRFLWEGLFPRPYWSDLSKNAEENGLDPIVVASLIRQESEFNPVAVSRASAVGLMQLLPGTGRKVAHDLKIRHFAPSQLYDPSVNLQLGTRYFRQMLDRFDGHLEYALAAYNAGSDRVDAWRAGNDYSGMDEFVESIPFTETREYVQSILRNAAVYKELYGGRGGAENASK